MHGVDHFDRVVANIKFLNKYRQETGKQIFLGVSFVEVEENKHTFQNIKETFEGEVDEVAPTKAITPVDK